MAKLPDVRIPARLVSTFGKTTETHKRRNGHDCHFGIVMNEAIYMVNAAIAELPEGACASNSPRQAAERAWERVNNVFEIDVEDGASDEDISAEVEEAVFELVNWGYENKEPDHA
jgi:hypothetical protein